ncbi:hypothetical protein ACQ86N_35400 [Puia sp. P3]|uniref:hypothetical protein n=1 Tax=Puia sp. P3 TaxID=3423952 RepID=UPI003D667375
MTFPQSLRPSLARIAGCLEDEVTVMNALTVNLHLLLLTFYRPTQQRYKILIEAGAFPSDQYVVETQSGWHGFNPADAVIEIRPREGEDTIREEDILKAIDEHKDHLAPGIARWHQLLYRPASSTWPPSQPPPTKPAPWRASTSHTPSATPRCVSTTGT